MGLLYCPSGDDPSSKLFSHAANPLPVHREGDIFRVFFSGRDAKNRSSVGAVDVDMGTRTLVREHATPFFRYGPRGSFYEAGVSIGCCYEVDGVTYMLFMGWQNPEGGHWRGDIGRLVVHPDGGLSLEDDTPLMASDPTDPLSLSYPWVIRQGPNSYRMWYGSTRLWNAGNGELLHVLHHAFSTDGHRWKREGLALPYTLGTAQAFSRPTVVQDEKGGYEMWFSYRGCDTPYRIGHAVSRDGRRWAWASDAVGMDVSAQGWDSEMVAYPFVFDHGGQRFMMYNGNGYGRTGFGLALLVRG